MLQGVNTNLSRSKLYVNVNCQLMGPFMLETAKYVIQQECFIPLLIFFKITLQVSAYPKFSDAIITVFQAIKYIASLPSH